ncbi:transcriptional repressor, partial [candidate division KSB1 bacterium]
MSDNDKINAFIQKCRENHLSVTPQRLAIYREIMDDRSHPNPEIIYKRVKKEFPTISFATVYKTLETFEKHGIISVVTTI